MEKRGSYKSEAFPEFIVHFCYTHDPGVHTFRNGDPGYPPSTDWEITDVMLVDGTIAAPTEHEDRILDKELDDYIEKNERSFFGRDDNEDYELKKLES